MSQHANTARLEYSLATACGYSFTFVVGDVELATALSNEIRPLNVVRLEPRCNRKDHKKELPKKVKW